MKRRDFRPRCVTYLFGSFMLAAAATAQPTSPAQHDFPPEVRNAITEVEKQCDGPEGTGFVTSFKIIGLHDPAYALYYRKACAVGGGRMFWCGASGSCDLAIYAKTDNSPYHLVFLGSVKGVRLRNVHGRTEADIKYHGSACGKAGAESCSSVLIFDGQKFGRD